MKSKSHFSFTSLILKQLSKFKSEMLIFCPKNLPLFRPKTRFSLSEERRRKTILDLCFQMSVMSWMSWHMRSRKEHSWIMLGQATSWLTCTESLSLKLKTLFMPLDPSILMRHPKNVKFTTSLRIGGQKFVIWNNLGITIPSLCSTVGTSTSSEAGTVWTKHPWNQLRD